MAVANELCLFHSRRAERVISYHTTTPRANHTTTTRALNGLQSYVQYLRVLRSMVLSSFVRKHWTRKAHVVYTCVCACVCLCLSVCRIKSFFVTWRKKGGDVVYHVKNFSVRLRFFLRPSLKKKERKEGWKKQEHIIQGENSNAKLFMIQTSYTTSQVCHTPTKVLVETEWMNWTICYDSLL